MKGLVPKPEGMVLYQIVDVEKDEIEFKVLINRDEIKSEEKITSRDLSAMELALITLYQPKGNYCGVRKDYKWE